MIALRLVFAAGRLHATPWDRAVNEGDTEWPPAPWRILRALVSAWHGAGEPEPETFRAVLDVLAEPPRFLLPPATLSHTRHYMPTGSGGVLNPNRTLVLDAFVAVEKNSEALIVWQRAALAEAERSLLERIAGGVTYLGRAESWCRCELLVGDVADADRLDGDYPDHTPVDLTGRSEGSGPTARRLCASAGDRGTSLLAALDETTAAMRKAKRTMPRGAAWAEYRFPARFGFTPVATLLERREKRMPPRRERFVIEAPSSGLRPSITETLTIAEAYRAAAIRKYSDRTGMPASETFSGKAPDGTPARGHLHAYVLPCDLDDDGKIDHLDVLYPAGSSHDEHLAATSVNGLWDWRLGIDRTERLAVTYLGPVELPGARVWETTTPISLDRFPKPVRGDAQDRRAADLPEAQIRRMLEQAVAPPFPADQTRAATIDVWSRDRTFQHRGGTRTLVPAFRSRREKGGQTPVVAATITFPTPISGLPALGRLAHFGLGQLRPVLDA